jgi:hypothetical protein
VGVFTLIAAKIGAVVAGAVLATGAMAGVASAAPMGGDYFFCDTGIGAKWCSSATSIPGGSATMSSYQCASYSCEPVLTGQISNGDEVPLHCYTYGQNVGGDTIWIAVDSLGGFFPDYYINTGSAADVLAHLYHC